MFPSPFDVRVVTVNWNGRAYLGKVLPSLEATICGKVLVVDKGSFNNYGWEDMELSLFERLLSRPDVLPLQPGHCRKT